MATSVELQKKHGVDVELFLELLETPKNGTFRALRKDVCYNCGGDMIIDGYFATGEMLSSGYTPAPDELVKNKFMECKDCGDWQAS